MSSESFPVAEAEDEGAQQLFISAEQGGIVGGHVHGGKTDSAFRRCFLGDAKVTELIVLMCDCATVCVRVCVRLCFAPSD